MRFPTRNGIALAIILPHSAPSVSAEPTVGNDIPSRLATDSRGFAMAFEGFARAESDSFFRRREERGRFYCGVCLADQLNRRGARRITEAAWMAAIEDAFMHPGLLQVRPGRPCETCKKPRPSIGAVSLDGEEIGVTPS
jgi:hypothetical protein